MRDLLISLMLDLIFAVIVYKTGKIEGFKDGWAKGYDARKHESYPGEYQDLREEVDK